jgi:hypothetical protein
LIYYFLFLQTENTNKEEEEVEIQNEEESECDNAHTKIQKKKTNKVSTPTKNNNNGNGPSSNDDCKETKKQPTTYNLFMSYKYLSLFWKKVTELFKEAGSNFKKKYQVLNFLPDDRYICSGLKKQKITANDVYKVPI